MCPQPSTLTIHYDWRLFKVALSVLVGQVRGAASPATSEPFWFLVFTALSFPRSAAWAAAIPLLSPLPASDRGGPRWSPRWPKCCYRGISTTPFLLTFPLFVCNCFSTHSSSQDDLGMHLSQMGWHVSFLLEGSMKDGITGWKHVCSLDLSSTSQENFLFLSFLLFFLNH